MAAQFVEVELDAFATISLVSSNSNSNGDLSGLVDDCRDLLLQLPQVKVSHCFREANCWADALARMGSSHVDVSLRFVSPPPHVIPLFCADLRGLFRSRLRLVAPKFGVGFDKLIFSQDKASPWYKVNTDAAIFSATNSVGIGVVIREAPATAPWLY
uniref:RNase H type-1 domain-containing protein n=1 Tax=Quercus lobata TaxID=97700 RepID=A0A7N2KUW1_QUELO